jgi:hypothetical protein
MTEDFKQKRISDLAAALVAASTLVKTNTPQAAVADDDYERIETVPRKRAELDKDLVSNIVAMEMLRMQQWSE